MVEEERENGLLELCSFLLFLIGKNSDDEEEEEVESKLKNIFFDFDIDVLE